MNALIILNHNPYDGTDVTRNALRLAGQLLDTGMSISIFLLNDAVDLGRKGVSPGVYDTNLGDKLNELIAKGVTVKACGSCLSRCGMGKGQPLMDGVKESTMPELARLVKTSDKILSF